jgi:hypothetical protein
MVRQDKRNADGSYFLDANGKHVGENIAYAWKAGVPLEQMERVVWQSVGFNQQGQQQFAWMSVNPINGVTSVWRKKDGVFGFVSLADYRTDNQLLP